MRKELLNHRPTSALRGQSPLCESAGTGHTSTHPSIFTKVLLVLLTTLLLPSAAWGQAPTIDIQYSSDFGKLWFYTSNESVTEVKYQWDEGDVCTYTVNSGSEEGFPVQAGTLKYWSASPAVDPVSVTYYGLIIGDTPLSNNNVGANGVVSVSDISCIKEGSVSFTSANSENNTSATLSLVDASIQSYACSAIEWIGNGPLSVQFSGTNSIKMDLNDDAHGDNQGFSIQGNSSSTLTLTGADNSSILTLRPSNSYKKAISGFISVSLSEGLKTYYTDDYSTATLTDEYLISLETGREVVIMKGYLGIAVAGVPVTNSNASEITGDHISGSVSFDSENNILTMDGATIDLSDNIGYPVVSSIEKLKVKLMGENKAILYSDCPNFIKYSGESSSAQLTFETGWSLDEYGKYSLGDLTINDAESSDNIANGYSISNNLIASDSYIDPEEAGEETSSWRYSIIEDTESVKVWYLKVYDLWIGSGRVISTALEAGQSGGFSFDPVKELLPATSTNSYPIKSSMEELVISMNGPNCGITPSSSTCAITFQSTDEQPTGKLKFVVAEGAEENMNKFIISNSGGAISGFSYVTFEDPLKLITPKQVPTTWDASTTNVVISDEVFYNLWVMGQQVSSGNASDILGAAQYGQPIAARFDAEENILTLNGLQLSNSTTYPTCIESGLESLTVTLSGDNKFQKGGDVTTLYGFKAQDGKTCNITFTADNSGSLSIATDEGNAVVGFNKVTYNNGLAPYMWSSKFNIAPVTLGKPEFIGVFDDETGKLLSVKVECIATIPNDQLGTPDQVDILSYDLKYTLDSGEETAYTGPLTISGPCTITAKTIVGNTSSPVATAKYFGFSVEELNVEYDGKESELTLPNIVPTIAEADGVTISVSSNSTIIQQKEGKWMVSGIGEAKLTLSIQGTTGTTPYTILNSKPLSLTVKSAPAPPTIGLEEDGLYFTGTVVALTPKVEGVTTKYKWDEGEATVLSTSLTNMPTIPTGTHKLTAWSEYTYNDGNTDVTLKGSEATATYTAGDFDLIIAGNGVDGTTAVTGDGIVGTVSYDKDNKTLTLNGATITGQIESNVAALKVYLVGNSTITPDEDAPFQYTGTDGSLTFESSETDNGELTLNGDYTLSGSTPNITITSGGYTTTTKFDTGLSYTFGDWIIEASKIYYNPHYGITINSYETTKCNKDNITKTSSGGVFSYSPQDKALSIPLDYNGSSTEIKSQRDELNVLISGNSTIRSIVFEKETDSEITSGSLTFKKNSASTAAINKLTIENTTSSGAAINGFSSVSFTAPMKLSVPETAPESWSSSISKAVITDEDIYDLWVEGERVTSGNKDNVKSEGSTPSVKFDPTDNILTLTNANLTVNGKNAIQSGLAKLTVNIVGYSNMIECQGATDAAFKGTSSNNEIVFTSNDPGCITVKNTVDPTKNPINGLEASYENCLGLLYSATNTEYTIETLQAPELQRTGTTDDGITVGLILPSGDKYANSTMYYTIAYKDKTEEDTEYSNAFTMTKPGTVTAYLVSNLGGQSNDEEAKYYGYPDAPYTLAKGKEITPAIYPTIEEDDLIGLNGSTSSDVNIATFTYSDGVVKALATGTVTLTAILTGSDMSFTVLNPKESSEPSNYNYPVTFSVIVGEDLDNMFAANQVFGTYYNTSEDITYKVPEGIKAYIVTGVSGNKVTIAETTVLPPSTPVLLERSNDAIAFTYITATEDDGTLPSGNLLKYASNQVTVPENGKLYILYNGEFVEATAGSIINLKCYLDLNSLNIPAGTRGFGIEGGSNGTTAIDAVSIEEFIVDSDQWYDVQGCRIAKPTKKGLYIKNGKKVVINNK